MMNLAIILIILVLLIAAIGYISGSLRITKFRRKGIYPQEGQTTEADIKRLALSGHKILAINAHREIYGSGLKKARKEVDKIIAENNRI